MPARILVLDDERPSCALVAACLRGDGHDPECVADPVAALAAAVRDPPDLVVTDPMMPGLVRALRAPGLDAPVLVTTAVPKAIGLAAAVLANPFDLGDLCDEVARILSG